ncbi:MAG TPA: aldo/keto reductase [Ktedonobacterales bacterium]|nr:aldo/keto reductase [Ktedonobacterales bacterium]
MAMAMTRLGRTGLAISRVWLGTMTFGNQADEETSFAIMDAADEAGVTCFDTADMYPLGGGIETRGRTEEIIGRWLAARGARERIVLATKVRNPMGPGPNEGGLSRKHIIAACEASLRRLQTDYLDLYQTHSPDPNTPIEETMSALDDLVRAGKARYVGCSNYQTWQLAEALMASERRGYARYESAQPRYNLLFRMIEDELLPLCRSQGLGMLAYNPLAGGMLTGRYRKGQAAELGTRFGLPHNGPFYQRRYWTDPIFDVVAQLDEAFSVRGKALNHVALAWTLAQPGISAAIIGASRPEQLRDTLAGADMTLDAEELALCDQAWYDLPRPRDPEIARR